MARETAVAVMLSCAIAVAAFADMPQLLNYQGKLADSRGVPVTGVKSMTFAFYLKVTLGTPIGGFTETQSVAVSNGLFNVLIGSATVGGVPPSIFGAPTVYLSVKVEGEEQTPRQRVGSVAFAFKAVEAEHAGMADDADRLDGSHAAAFAAVLHSHADLEARIAALEALLANVTRAGNDMTFSGMNVHIINGLGDTETTNGVGNLIVGYNETRGDGDDNHSGSHNLVVGSKQNFSSYGGLVAGQSNTISGKYACVSGGASNTASGPGASASGGAYNTASGAYASVSGGASNTASGGSASVCGGENNTASGKYSFVAGGGAANVAYGNVAFADYSAILGGARTSRATPTRRTTLSASSPASAAATPTRPAAAVLAQVRQFPAISGDFWVATPKWTFALLRSKYPSSKDAVPVDIEVVLMHLVPEER